MKFRGGGGQIDPPPAYPVFQVPQPEITKARFLLLELNHVLVYNSTIFKLTILSFVTFLFKTRMPTKKDIRKNRKNFMFNNPNSDRKLQFLG